MRDLVSYVVGTVILVWEVFSPGGANAIVVLAGMTLLGLPLALGGGRQPPQPPPQ